jgi:hypothetical protein
MVVWAFNPALRRQRQVNLCELASWVYRTLQNEFPDSHGCYTKKLPWKQNKNNKKLNRMCSECAHVPQTEHEVRTIWGSWFFPCTLGSWWLNSCGQAWWQVFLSRLTGLHHRSFPPLAVVLVWWGYSFVQPRQASGLPPIQIPRPHHLFTLPLCLWYPKVCSRGWGRRGSQAPYPGESSPSSPWKYSANISTGSPHSPRPPTPCLLCQLPDHTLLSWGRKWESRGWVWWGRGPPKGERWTAEEGTKAGAGQSLGPPAWLGTKATPGTVAGYSSSLRCHVGEHLVPRGRGSLLPLRALELLAGNNSL